MTWRELTAYAGKKGVYRVGMSRDEVLDALGSKNTTRHRRRSSGGVARIFDDTAPIYNSYWWNG